MAWDTFWLFLTIFEVCNDSGNVEGMKAGYTAAVILMAGIWSAFLVARYLPVNRWIKGGIIIDIASVWLSFTNDVYVYFMEHKKQLTILSADFSNWSNPICFNANVYVLVLLLGGIASILLIVYGIIKEKRNKKF